MINGDAFFITPHTFIFYQEVVILSQKLKPINGISCICSETLQLSMVDWKDVDKRMITLGSRLGALEPQDKTISAYAEVRTVAEKNF